MKITITNWTKYNPRNDIKRGTWFRFENDFFENPKLFDLTDSEKLCWIYLLCMVAKKGNGTVEINERHAKHIGRINLSTFKSTLDKLQSLGILTIDTNVSVRARTHVYATNERTNERIYRSSNDDHASSLVMNKSLPPRREKKYDFESLYDRFPRKQGKKKGLLAARRQIKSDKAYGDLSRAIDAYAAECRADNRDKKYIKQFSTFMNCWEDYIDPSYQRVANELDRFQPTTEGKCTTE